MKNLCLYDIIKQKWKRRSLELTYIVKSSERLCPAASETETKALLYLINFREDSEEVYYFVVDFFNDLTGMCKMADKM